MSLKTIKDLYKEYKNNPAIFPKFQNTLKKNYVFSDTTGKLFLKLFIFNDKYTKDGWKGDAGEIPTNLKMNIGHPLTIAADNKFLFAHPGSKKLAYAINEQIQKPFVIGENVALSEPAHNPNGDYFAIYEITNEDARNFFNEIKGNDEIPIPFWSSPQIVHDSSESDDNIKRFKIQHNVLTDAPSFGKDAAIAEALCQGDAGQCMPVLTKQSSLHLHDLIEEDKCSFCVTGRLTDIFMHNVETLQASLSQLNSSQSVDSSKSSIMSEQTQSQNTSQATQQGTGENLGQPVKPNNNNTIDTKSEITKTQFQLPPNMDEAGLRKLIDSAISERFAKPPQEQQPTKEEPKKEEPAATKKQQEEQLNKINLDNLDPEIKAKLEEGEANKKEIQKLKDRVYKDDVGNLLLEYYKNNNAFKDEKAELDEKRYSKVLDYWTKKGMQLDEIKETIEIVSLMYNPNVTAKKQEAEITTKKASTHSEDVTIYDVPKTQTESENTTSNKSNDRPYWDRSVYRNTI